MDFSLEGTYYRTALLLGLVRGEVVHRWAEQAIEREPEPLPELIEVVSVPANDLSALRHAGSSSSRSLPRRSFAAEPQGSSERDDVYDPLSYLVQARRLQAAIHVARHIVDPAMRRDAIVKEVSQKTATPSRATT